jgi:presenilin-like A22 family membrane protease
MKFELLMKLWFFFAFVAGISVALSAFGVEPMFAIVAAAVITLLKFKETDIVTHNLGEILLYGGIVALFVPMLNLFAVTLLLIIMSVYDFIAVFITKHMVSLAKMQESLGIFSGIIVVNKDEVAILGGGDIAFTMLFASVVLRDFGSMPALLAVYGAALGILALIIIGEKKKFYPAMPFVTIGCLLGYGLSMII